MAHGRRKNYLEAMDCGGRKFFCVFKIGSSIQLELDM